LGGKKRKRKKKLKWRGRSRGVKNKKKGAQQSSAFTNQYNFGSHELRGLKLGVYGTMLRGRGRGGEKSIKGLGNQDINLFGCIS
jgi:hypothetical protein